MKTYELVTIPAQPERVDLKTIAVVCDLCGLTIIHLLDRGEQQLNPQMVERFGDAFETHIELKAGQNNLNGGVGETTSADICPNCFENKLLPWLREQGAEPRVEPWYS